MTFLINQWVNYILRFQLLVDVIHCICICYIQSTQLLVGGKEPGWTRIRSLCGQVTKIVAF